MFCFVKGKCPKTFNPIMIPCKSAGKHYQSTAKLIGGEEGRRELDYHVNEVMVDYQDDGSSRGMWRLYWNNPQGFAFLRKFDMQHTHSWKRKYMDNIHYMSHSIRCRNGKFFQAEC